MTVVPASESATVASAIAATATHRIPVRRRGALLGAGLGATVLISVLAAVTLGPADLSVGEVLRSLGIHLGFGDALGLEPLTGLRDAIVWELRVPRVLTAGAVGAGLAVCGVVLQSLTRNPLADPYLLGLSSGASLGAVAVLLLGVSLLLPVAAFAGAMAALVLTLILAGRGGTSRTILAGIAVSQGCAALVSLVVFWTASGDSYREILSWLMGSVAGATWTSVAVVMSAMVIGILLCLTGNLLDAFAFGDDAATALGVPAGRVRVALFVATALLTGALVSQSGSIGFVGLILPHGVRLVLGSRHRLVLPVSALAGAVFLIWADTLARTAFAPRELPVGVVTAVVGVPVFAWLLRRQKAAS